MRKNTKNKCLGCRYRCWDSSRLPPLVSWEVYSSIVRSAPLKGIASREPTFHATLYNSDIQSTFYLFVYAVQFLIWCSNVHVSENLFYLQREKTNVYQQIKHFYVQHCTLWRFFLWCIGVYLTKLMSQLSSANKETDIFERIELISHGSRDIRVFLRHLVQTSSGNHSTAYQLNTEVFSMGIKSSEDATDQRPLSNAEVNVYSCTSTPPFVFMTLECQV